MSKVKPKPEIDAEDKDLARVTKAAWEALLEANDPPKFFRYGGVASWIERGDAGEPVVKEVTQDRMRYTLARVARWHRLTRDMTRVPASPPESVVKDVLATPNKRLPILERIVEVPVFSREGKLNTAPGYDPASRCFYRAPKDFNLLPVSERPSRNDLIKARELILEELLVDFPFASGAERAHAVCMLLLPFFRNLIDGPTPLHLIEKPSPGTGATLRADDLCYPALGRFVTATTEARDEDEWRRRILATLRASPVVVLIDNLKRRLESGALASAITAETFEDRLIRTSDVVRAPVHCVWAATGNNPMLSEEMVRRAIRIRLDAATERPWLREPFKHPKLKNWVQVNRPALVWAALVLGQAWVAAGMPRGKRVLGKFEDWAEVMGGVLDVAEIPGFLENLDDFYANSKLSPPGWSAFVNAWWQSHGDREVTASELVPAALSLELGDGPERSQTIRLGKQLGSMRGRCIGGFRIVNTGMRQGSARWKLETESVAAKPWD